MWTGSACLVAPLAGAWIEIKEQKNQKILWKVAPLAGAWIEIAAASFSGVDRLPVAPLAGAWIEILRVCIFWNPDFMSLPSRERGLKSFPSFNFLTAVLSLPSRERGLKFS